MPIILSFISPKPVKIAAVREEAVKVIDKIAKKIQVDFEKTTATWHRKPDFQIKREVTDLGLLTTIFTESEIYGWVTKGTKPHDIVPKNATFLQFPSMFEPKTKPGFIGSGPGRSGGPIAKRDFVRHPGIEPRQFEEAIAKKWEKVYAKEMEAAVARGLKRAGF